MEETQNVSIFDGFSIFISEAFDWLVDPDWQV